MISQELRKKWQIIKPVQHTGTLKPCSCCGAIPALYQIDPVGLWVRDISEDQSFFAVRCSSCGMTGNYRSTGMNIWGDQIDKAHAGEQAVNAWNHEQEEHHDAYTRRPA